MSIRKPTVLLVNPPVYDFTAYDFWLKPYGLLNAAGTLCPACDLTLYDFMDRLCPPQQIADDDPWGRGKYLQKKLPKPPMFSKIPRHYRRFGLPAEHFRHFLDSHPPFDVCLIATSMTYWYPGVKEILDIQKMHTPHTKNVLGGFLVSACPDFAAGLGADLTIAGDNFEPLYNLLGIAKPTPWSPPAWNLYPSLKTGVMKLTQGCPFACSYCFVPQSGVPFQTRPLQQVLAELDTLEQCGATNIAFYDDALLHRPQELLIPFLEKKIAKNSPVQFHTPNGLHARFLTRPVADLMVRAGFKTFYLGFESNSPQFQNTTGAKIESDELAHCVENLKSAGASPSAIIAYEILGHPLSDCQHLEESMRYVHRLGIRIMLSDFSPIPGTPDGELCRRFVDLDEPLTHNKTAFPILSLGFEKVNYYKQLAHSLNAAIR